MSLTTRVNGPTYLVWCSSARLTGIGFWGRPAPQHARCFTRAFDMDVDRRQRRSVVDVRRVESIEPATFELLSNYVRSQAEKLRERVSAQALLRPDGLVGTVVAGFYSVLEHSYPVEVFTNPYDALNWLGAADESSAIAEIDRALDNCAGIPAALRALRTHLKRNPGNASLTTVAAALGLSTRGLQRKLREANTSFQAEQNATQIHLAKRLLRDTNHDIKRVAFEVGCSSAAAFSVLFRKFEGQSPSAWRKLATRQGQAPMHSLCHQPIGPPVLLSTGAKLVLEDRQRNCTEHVSELEG